MVQRKYLVGAWNQKRSFVKQQRARFSHGTLHTNRPLKTPLGTFEGQMVFGNLQFSGFYPYGINPVVNIGSSAQLTPLLKPDSLRGTGTHSYMNAMQLVWQPRWLPGLFLG